MMRLSHASLCCALALALAGPAHAADPAPSAPTTDPSLLAELRQLASQVQAQQQEIERLREQVETLQMGERGRGVSGPVVAQQVPAAQAASTPATAPADAPTAAEPRAAEPPMQAIGQAQRDDDAQRREQDKALVVREHAPLFERKFTVDAGLSYSYYDRRQLTLSGFLALDAIFLGTINLDQSKATVGTLDLTGRYGLTDRFSVEASVPYVWRDTRFVSGGAGGSSSTVSEVRMQSSGVGDASLAAYYQLVKESPSWPDLVASLRMRAPTGRDPFGLKLIQPDGDNNNLNVPEDLPTGTGVWNVGFNVSALRTYDPVILFGNVGYVWNRPQDFDDISPVLDQVVPARVALGNTIVASGGMAIALNDRSAISFSVSTALSGATHTRAPGGDEQRVAGSSSNSTTFNIGGTYALPSRWTLNGQLAAGLTPDAPNFVFALRASQSF